MKLIHITHIDDVIGSYWEPKVIEGHRCGDFDNFKDLNKEIHWRTERIRRVPWVERICLGIYLSSYDGGSPPPALMDAYDCGIGLHTGTYAATPSIAVSVDILAVITFRDYAPEELDALWVLHPDHMVGVRE